MSKDLEIGQCESVADLANLHPVEQIRHANKAASSLQAYLLTFRINELFDILLSKQIKVETGDGPRREAQELIESDKALDDADVPSTIQGHMLSIPERIAFLANRAS